MTCPAQQTGKVRFTHFAGFSRQATFLKPASTSFLPRRLLPQPTCSTLLPCLFSRSFSTNLRRGMKGEERGLIGLHPAEF